ncbi:MAG: hypothetical protein ACQEVA_16440, partial [Myxococcota bacterium]
MRARLAVLLSLTLLVLAACEDTDKADPSEEAAQSNELLHAFPKMTMEPGSEKVECIQWSVQNEKSLYVNSVTMANDGGFHHSNWFVVPEDVFAGDDGFFDCEERGWSNVTAATRGTVLFAQSTQAFTETQSFPGGVTLEIPPNHKVVGNLHLLNAAPRELDTQIRLKLGLVHPRDVENIATPFQMVYSDLAIPGKSESMFMAECDLRDQYERTTGQSWDELEIYHVLPHYHELGNHFELRKYGGEDDGELIHKISGFDAEANGKSFEEPVSLAGTDGLSFGCGFDNPREDTIGWGIGDQEMCMMLGYSNGQGVFEGNVRSGSERVGEVDGTVRFTGPCSSLTIKRSQNQSMPSEEEIQGELYVPESNTDEQTEFVPECEDTPADAEPLREPTLTNLEDQVFSVSCAFSACHGGNGAAAGLSLVGDDVHGSLMDHQVASPTDMPLVDPGNPDNSW